MVNIAIAGGSSNVGLEVIEALLAANKHRIFLLSRKDAPADEHRPNVHWAKTDYSRVEELADILRGTDTVLSFIDSQLDKDNAAQKTLIDACVKAKVRRFAPSEWSWSYINLLPFYENKRQIRTYLVDLNRYEKKLEHTLFTPVFFLNYLTYPYPSSKHLSLFELWLDFVSRRTLTIALYDRITLTDIRDIAAIVAKAIDYPDEWPVIGGIRGNDLSVGEILDIGKKARGHEFQVEMLKKEDLENGQTNSSWLPTVGHHSVDPEVWKSFVGTMVSSFLLLSHAGDGSVGDEWNQIFPDFEFVQAEEFLVEAWKGKEGHTDSSSRERN